MSNFRCIRVEHRGKKRIAIYFEKDQKIINDIRKIEDSRWSKTMRCWHVPDSLENRVLLHKYSIQINNSEEENTESNYSDFEENKAVKIRINTQENLIYIKVPYYESIVTEIKKITGAWWHPGAKVWSVEYSKERLKYLDKFFKGLGFIVNIRSDSFSAKLSSFQYKKPASREQIPVKFIEQLKLENKSNRTIEIYTGFISQIIKEFRTHKLDEIDIERLRNYILTHRNEKGYSESYQNQMVSAIKSFYKIMYEKEFEAGALPRPKKGRQLPKVLPREDIEKMFNNCHNDKHRMILLLLYGFGLRVGEVVRLELSHINLERSELTVVSGKGNKDRVLPISRSILPAIKKYLQSYLPEKYVITGQYGEEYSSKSIQNIIRNLAFKAGIKKRVTPHIIRHCYATHMLERGVDLRYIQKLLGHKSSKTTEIYTHVSTRKLIDLGSPADDINF